MLTIETLMLIMSMGNRANIFCHIANIKKMECLQTITFKYSVQEFTGLSNVKKFLHIYTLTMYLKVHYLALGLGAFLALNCSLNFFSLSVSSLETLDSPIIQHLFFYFTDSTHH